MVSPRPNHLRNIDRHKLYAISNAGPPRIQVLWSKNFQNGQNFIFQHHDNHSNWGNLVVFWIVLGKYLRKFKF